MKMGKASQEEVDAAMRLANVLEGVAKGEYPSAFDKDGEWINNEDEPNFFDENDPEHLRAFYDRTMACLTGGLFRVVGGMLVLLDPTNEVVDPDKSYLDLHPKFQTLADRAEAMESLLLWALYHSQGGSSAVGQPIRKFLGIGQHDHLTAEQIDRAKKAVQGEEATANV